jgi:iron complex transport system ATP-binding protein
MKNKIILQASKISIGYTSKKVQHSIASNIDLSLEKGKLIALIGANGIGKSTLLRTLTGIQKPLSGTVSLNEKNIHNLDSLTLAQNLSVVLTEKLPPSNLTVWELIALGRQPYTNWIGQLSSQDRQAIQNALTATGLTAIQHQKHFTLSDGQLQKTLIARSLAQDTPLIILDEPTTHLDLVHKLKLLKLLKNLCDTQQKCILFSTHDIELALTLCDQILVMTSQKVVQGRPEDLIQNGTIGDVFRDESIQFDPNTKTFNLVF